jgi:uncharacterized protein (DUF169 family)
MTDYTQMADRLEALLGLEKHAVAISFADEAPAGIPRVPAAAPAGCAYWNLAGAGQSFYTTPEDHLNCTIGAYTHGVTMPAEKMAELQQTIGQMIGLSYLNEAEIPKIPHRTAPFRVAVYAPLAQASLAPDVVVVRGNARNFMLLTEAAMAAGIGTDGGIMARPTCAFIPETLASGRATPSFACIGNRVYTGLGDGELYFAIPGAEIAEVVSKLEKIVAANRALEGYHQARMAQA